MPFIGGTLATYNGVAFPDGRTETFQFLMRMQYDEAGRTVSHVVYTIGLRTIVIDTDTTDDLMEEVVAALSEPGKPFVFTGAGVGNLQVNIGSVKDVKWGPKPQVIGYRPLGQGACELEWVVEVCLPACLDAAYQNAIMEFNYELTFDTDRNGYNNRVYKGYIIIPQTRNGDNRRLIDSADKYFDSINPRLPENYRMGPRTRTLDKSKNRIDFTIVHESMGNNIPPPGVVDVRASHSVHSMDKGFQSWIGTIRAEYDCAVDFEPQKCWPYFFQLVRQRLSELQKVAPAAQQGGGGGLGGFLLAVGGGALAGAGVGAAAPVPGGTAGGAAAGAAVGAIGFFFGGGNNPQPVSIPIPLSFNFEEPDIFGKPQRAAFELSYWFNRPITDLLQASGVYKPVKDNRGNNNDWNLWQASLQSSAFLLRGNDDARFNPADDVILDLCISRRRVQMQTERKDDGQRRLETIPDFNFGPCPSPEQSWMLYENKIEVQAEDKVIEHKPLPKPTTETFTSPSSSSYPNAAPGSFGPSSSRQGGYHYKSDLNTPKSTVHRRTDDSIEIFLVGKALRVCYDIEPPSLKKFGDNEVVSANRTEKGEGFKTWVVGNYGRPVVAASWRLRYIIPTRPRQQVRLGTTPDPMITREQPRMSTFQ